MQVQARPTHQLHQLSTSGETHLNNPNGHLTPNLPIYDTYTAYSHPIV